MFPTVNAALECLTINDLKGLLALLPAETKPTRKKDLMAAIKRHLAGKKLQALWERLDKLQQLAVGETIYSPEGVFNENRFQAKYDSLPAFATEEDSKYRYNEAPSLLRLFIYSDQRWEYHPAIVPDELKQRLLAFVPEPATPALKTLDELPSHVELSEKEYEWHTGDEGITLLKGKKAFKSPRKQPKVKITTHQIPLISRSMERDAVADLQTLLRLIDKGKFVVSDKTLRPSKATMKEITSFLRNGDFYELKPKKTKWEQEIGPIKAFAWPLLLQAAKLAELHGNKLALTKAGRTALTKPPADTLRATWQRWSKTKVLDELNRVNVIKGQQGKGKRSLSAPASRRAIIVEALQQSPVGTWVKFDDFSRYMQAAGYEFIVTREPWRLYIEDTNYGNLGYEGYHGWNILQDRYLLCLFFEYMATLGILDVAYIPPQGARRDYRDLWGTDEFDFLSRYDGLMYVRLNPLGAYCLGLANTYTPSETDARTQLTILPSLQVNVASGTLSTEEALLLDTWAEKETETVWRLNRDKILNAIENGHAITELQEFLQVRDQQGLPETVEGFLTSTARKASALKPTGTALLIECVSVELAEHIAQHEHTQQWCLRAGERHLAVNLDAESQFRKAVHGLGYGMPKV